MKQCSTRSITLIQALHGEPHTSWPCIMLWCSCATKGIGSRMTSVSWQGWLQSPRTGSHRVGWSQLHHRKEGLPHSTPLPKQGSCMPLFKGWIGSDMQDTCTCKTHAYLSRYSLSPSPVTFYSLLPVWKQIPHGHFFVHWASAQACLLCFHWLPSLGWRREPEGCRLLSQS